LLLWLTSIFIGESQQSKFLLLPECLVCIDPFNISDILNGLIFISGVEKDLITILER